MSASIKTILIIGGTSGIGESFARRFHQMGKKVIITGRRKDRLAELKISLPGLETYHMDNTDLAALSGHVEKLFTNYLDINTVWINSGIQYASDVKDINSSADERVIKEVTTNMTAPIILARHSIPRLLERNGEANFMMTTSGLAFVPLGVYAVYNPTKAAMHSYLVGLRQTLKNTNVNVLEIVPPYVGTALDAGHKDVAGGHQPMSLKDYTDETFEILDGSAAKDLKEVAAGSAAISVRTWRSAIGDLLISRGFGG